MTVSSPDSSVSYSGDGVTTLLPVPFYFLAQTDLVVTRVNADASVDTLVLGSDYSVSGAGVQSGGAVTMFVAPANFSQILINRVVPVTQETDYVANDPFPAESHERALDKLTMLVQQAFSYLSRALLRPVGKNDYDAQGRKIVNLGDGSDEQDTVNIRTMRDYVDIAIAGVVGGFGYFIQAGVGAVARTFQDKLREQPITIEDYLPNIVYVEAPYGQAEVDAATPADDALDAAMAAAASVGRKVGMRERVYRFDRISEWPSELNIEGVACGQWIPTANPSIAGGIYNPDMSGTVMLFCGNAVKDQTALGITDCRTGGGVVANDNIKDPGFDDNYSLTSFYNDDANFATGAAATPKMFSAAVKLGRGVQGVRCRNIRIMKAFKGIEGYLTAEIGYGDDWDVGLYLDNATDNYFENVQTVGYWQMQGRLARVGVVGGEGAAVSASLEHNVYDGCVFTGMVGAEIRGIDSHRIIGVGADYIDLPWAANHPFSVASLAGFIRTTSNTTHTFSGVAVVGGNLRLTGVTPTPAGLALTASVIPALTANGMALWEDRNCIISSMDHQSGNRVTAAGMGAFRKARPSTAFMMSGYTLRGYSAPGTKLILQDDVAIHNHWVIDVIHGPKFEVESKDANGLGLGVRLIASPAEGSNTRVAHPSGSSFRLKIDTLRNTNDVDYRPTGALNPPRFPLGTGLLTANQLLLTAVHDSIDNGRFFRPGVGGTAGIKRSDGGLAVYYDDAAGQVRAAKELRLDANKILNSAGDQRIDITGSGTGYRGNQHVFSSLDGTLTHLRISAADWRAGVDNSTDIGAPALRMKTIYAGTGSINTSDADHKTPIRPFSLPEIVVAQQLIGEIGMYQFLDSVAVKGDAARWHVGMTVQRAIEIFEDAGLDPYRNAFVCYDEWEDQYESWDAEYETKPAVVDPETGAELAPETQILIKEAGSQLVTPAGHIYAFRNDQLAFALLAGVSATMDSFEQRLAALEGVTP